MSDQDEYDRIVRRDLIADCKRLTETNAALTKLTADQVEYIRQLEKDYAVRCNELRELKEIVKEERAADPVWKRLDILAHEVESIGQRVAATRSVCESCTDDDSVVGCPVHSVSNEAPPEPEAAKAASGASLGNRGSPSTSHVPARGATETGAIPRPSEARKCPQCLGKKTVLGMADGWGSQIVERPCATCAGTGELRPNEACPKCAQPLNAGECMDCIAKEAWENEGHRLEQRPGQAGPAADDFVVGDRVRVLPEPHSSTPGNDGRVGLVTDIHTRGAKIASLYCVFGIEGNGYIGRMTADRLERCNVPRVDYPPLDIIRGRAIIEAALHWRERVRLGLTTATAREKLENAIDETPRDPQPVTDACPPPRNVEGRCDARMFERGRWYECAHKPIECASTSGHYWLRTTAEAPRSETARSRTERAIEAMTRDFQCPECGKLMTDHVHVTRCACGQSYTGPKIRYLMGEDELDSPPTGAEDDRHDDAPVRGRVL